MGQSRRPADRPSKTRRSIKPPVLLIAGFEPFGGERSNPSWEIARRLDGERVGGFEVKALRLPVAYRRETRRIVEELRNVRAAAFMGLGQAGGRPAISLERIAINLLDERAR